MTSEFPASDMLDDHQDLSDQDWRKVAAFWRAKAQILQGEIKSIVTFRPDDAQASSAALSFSHDFGLLEDAARKRLMNDARYWLEAWQKEFRDMAPTVDYRNGGAGLDEARAIEKIVKTFRRDAFMSVISMMLGVRGPIDVSRTDKAVMVDEAIDGLINEVMQMAVGAGEDPDEDDIAVAAFALAMSEKLAMKRRDGRGGWDDPDEVSQAGLSRMLREHVDKGDPVDVANFAMMLHQRGEKICSGGKS